MNTILPNTTDDDFFWRFLISLRDGTADSTNLDRFEQLLLNSQAYRRLYLQTSRVESEIFGYLKGESIERYLFVDGPDAGYSANASNDPSHSFVEQETSVLDLIKEIQQLPQVELNGQVGDRTRSNFLSAESDAATHSSSVPIPASSKRSDSVTSNSRIPHWVQQLTVPTLTSVVLHLAIIGLLGALIIRNDLFHQISIGPTKGSQNSSAINQSAEEVFKDANALAFVIHQDNAYWSNGERVKLRTGLSRGVHALKSGTVELLLRNDVHLALSAKTEFEINKTSSINLRAGRIDARVPTTQTGFTIVTAVGKVVDLGTEFQVALESDSMTVDVREGSVLVSPTNVQIGPLPLVAGRRVKVEPNGAMEVSKMENNPSPFNSLVTSESNPEASQRIGPVQDCSLVSGDQKKTNENAGYLHVYSLDHRTDHALIQFDLSLFQDEPIESATLVLHATHIYGKNERNRPMTIHAVAKPWRATEATWGNRLHQTPWQSPGGDFDTKIYASATDHPTHDSPVEWDITELVQEWCSQKRPNYGLLIQSSHPNQLHFHSMDAMTPKLRPQLILVKAKR